MVTAILPSMITPGVGCDSSSPARPATPANRHSVSPSESSELTITQSRHHQRILQRSPDAVSIPEAPAPTWLAGFVGLFTGFGALVALVLFLPLPAAFRSHGVDAGTAVTYSYYVIGAIAFAVAASVSFGLRNLVSEEGKGWHRLVKAQKPKGENTGTVAGLSYTSMIYRAIVLGFQNPTLALGYLGGFVARASSVGISLFIPLFVNAWFISSGLCDQLPHQSGSDTDHCRRAYVLAAELTGVSQLVALLFAPVFGYLADCYPRYNAPLLAAALLGIVGYIGFANLETPDPKATGGSLWVFFVVALLGISQIGAIVCSLGLLARSVLESDPTPRTFDAEAAASSPLRPPLYNAVGNDSEHSTKTIHPSTASANENNDLAETSRLLSGQSVQSHDRQHLKGSVAGVYSLAGGAGILLLTKLGGYLFDESPAAPFYMLAVFNCVLLLFGLISGFTAMRRNG